MNTVVRIRMDPAFCSLKSRVKRVIQVLEEHLLPLKTMSLAGKILLLSAKPSEATRVLVLNWTSCSADLAPTENIWSIMKINC